MRIHAVIVLFILFAAPVAAIPVRWSTNYEKARAEGIKQERDLFVWLSRADSRHTDHLKSRVWMLESLSGRIHAQWLPVHVENPGFRLQQQLGVRATPGIAIVAPDGTVRARCLVADWGQARDVDAWLDLYEETIDNIDKRVERARDKPKDFTRNLNLARNCIAIGRPGAAIDALTASLGTLNENLENEQEDSDNPEDWDKDTVEQQREFDLTMALARTRRAGVMGSAPGLVAAAVECYRRHEDWLNENSSEHAVHAAILLAYQDFLDKRPQDAFRRVDRVAVRIPLSQRRIEVNYWAGFYAWKSGDDALARISLRRVISIGPNYHPLVEAAEGFLRLL